MSARGLIDKACLTVNVTCDHTYASAVLEALTAAGWRLVGPDEVDPVTVERCAQIAEAERRSDLAVEAGYTPVWQRHARNIAAAIRAIASGGKQ